MCAFSFSNLTPRYSHQGRNNDQESSLSLASDDDTGGQINEETRRATNIQSLSLHITNAGTQSFGPPRLSYFEPFNMRGVYNIADMVWCSTVLISSPIASSAR